MEGSIGRERGNKKPGAHESGESHKEAAMTFSLPILRSIAEEVSGHRVLIKRGPGNRGPTECGTTREATSGMSS